MRTPYIQDKELRLFLHSTFHCNMLIFSVLRNFVRTVSALPFLNIGRIERVLDILSGTTFNPNSPFYDAMIKFRDSFLTYFENFWIKGDFPPIVWNHEGRYKDLTNNKVNLYKLILIL